MASEETTQVSGSAAPPVTAAPPVKAAVLQRRRRTSSRRTRGIAPSPHDGVPILNFRRPWTQHYIDIGHCRIQKCTARIQTASPQEIAHLSISFCSMAIKASTEITPEVKRERVLMEYARAVMAHGGVDINDQDTNHRTAVAAAAYYGYTELLRVLLVEGKCSALGGVPHAMMAAVSNGQHECMRILFQYRTDEITELLQREASSRIRVLSSLRKAIQQMDIEAVRLLRDQGHAMVSDYDLLVDCLRKQFEFALEEIYPKKNSMRWSKELHWTFPATDRRVLNWLYHAAARDRESNDKQLPLEIWLRVFSFVGRFWWAPLAAVDWHNL